MQELRHRHRHQWRHVPIITDRHICMPFVYSFSSFLNTVLDTTEKGDAGKLDLVTVKGKSEPTVIYEVMGLNKREEGFENLFVCKNAEASKSDRALTNSPM